MTYVRIGHPPRLTVRARLGWAARVARSMLLVCAVGVALLVAVLMAADAIR